jgi:hypothetical protein
MPRSCKPTPLSHEFVQAFKTALAVNSGRDSQTIGHHVPVRAPGAIAPRMYTVHVAAEPGGAYLATCVEFPEILVSAGTEDEAVLVARTAILLRLQRDGGGLSSSSS